MENFEPDQCSFQRNQSLSQICCNDGAAVGQHGLSIFRSRPLAVPLPVRVWLENRMKIAPKKPLKYERFKNLLGLGSDYQYRRLLVFYMQSVQGNLGGDKII